MPGAVGSGCCAFPPLTQPFIELAQGKALNKVRWLWALQKSPKTRNCLVGCLGAAPCCQEPLWSEGPGWTLGAAHPSSGAALFPLPARAHWSPQGVGRWKQLPHPPSGCAEAWGCRVGAVQAVQPVTNPWSYRSLVSQVFVSAGWGAVGMAGGGWRCLPPPRAAASLLSHCDSARGLLISRGAAPAGL